MGRDRTADELAAPRKRKKNWGAQDYADVVRRCLDTAAHHIIMAGEHLIGAKGKLEHGEWLRMFKDHANPVDRPIPFGARTGQMLMKIADHPVLSDANHGSLLPTSWRTLYELSKLPEPVLTKALTVGFIHPAMERKHVAGLPGRVAATGGSCVVTTEASTPPAEYFDRLRDEVLARPKFAGRWQALQTLERAEETLAKRLADVRERARQARQRLTEDVLKTIEVEHGPIRFRSTVLMGKGAGTERECMGTEVGLCVLPDVVEAVEEEQFRCTSCDRALLSGEVIEVRECPHCEERFDGAGGQNCPSCNRPFSRLITAQGCPDCLGDDGDVVHADDEAALEPAVPGGAA